MPRSSNFATFVTADLDPRAEANFDRLERRAVSTYANISRAAQTATRATAGLLGGNGTAGGGQSRNLRAQETNIRAVSAAAERAARSQDANTAATHRSNQVTAEAAQRQATLAKSLRTTATTLNIVQGPLGPLAGRVWAVAGALEELTGFRLGIAGVGAALFALGRGANNFTEVTSRLKPLYETQTQFNAALADVEGIAGRARSSLAPIVDLYVKLNSAAESVGISQSRAARLTELAAKAASLSGGSRQTREAGLLQFSQGIGSDRLGGDELRSIQENTFALAKAIANGFKNADGSIGTTIGNLKDLGAQGKLTAKEVADALDRSAGDIETRFARLPRTLSASSTEFINAVTEDIGRLNETVGATSALAGAISFLAQNLNGLIGIALGVGTAFAAIKLAGLVSDAASFVRQTAVMSGAVKQLGVRRQQVAAESLAQHQREIAALEAERAEILENIQLLERKRAAAQRDAARATPNPSSGYAGSSRRLAAANDEEARSVRGLVGERQRLNVINNALVAANDRATGATDRLKTAQETAAKRSGLLKSTVGGLLSVFNPWAIAIGLATTALYALATASTAAERSTSTFTAEQRNAYDQIGKTTAALDQQTDSYLRLARAKQNRANADALTAGDQARQRFGAQLSIAAEDVGGDIGQRLEELGKLARAGGRLDKIYKEFDEIRSRTPALQGKGLVGGLGGAGKAAELVDKSFDDVRRAAYALRANAQNTRDIDAEFNRRNQPTPARSTAATSVTSTTQLGANAIAAAVDEGTDTIRAAGARRRAAVEALDKQFGVKAGQVAPDKASDYQTQRTAIERQYNQEVSAIKAGEAAKRDARRAAARQERVDRAQTETEAETQRDKDLLALEQRKSTLSQGEYNAERVKILAIYDQEISKLHDTAAASNSAARQQIADARAVAKAAEAAGSKREDILGRYSEEPKALVKAGADIADLQRFVDTAVDGVAFIGKTKDEIQQIAEINPLGTGIYTQEMADADTRRIETGVRRPLTELTVEFERQRQIQELLLSGRDDEARAYERAYQIADQIGEVNADEYRTILDSVTAEEHRNRLLDRRSRLVQSIEGIVDDTRSSLEELIVDFPKRGFSAAGDLWKNMQRRLLQVNATQIVDKLLGGADEKVRALVSGRAAIESNTRFFANKVADAGNSAVGLSTALNQATDAVQNFANQATGAPIGGTAAPGGGDIAAQVAKGLSSAAGSVGGGAAGGLFGTLATAVTSVSKAATAANDNAEEIVVTGQQQKRQAATQTPIGKIPTAREAYNAIGESVGGKLDSLFNSGGFFKKIGGSFGTALQGAGEGAIASGFAKALGVKQSQTGAQIGGALGALSGIPGGSIIGGLLGGTLGGLLKKTKKGTATIGASDAGTLDIVGTAGNSQSRIKAATTAADSILGTVGQIADALGGSIDPTRGSVSIGVRDKNYRVDTSGKGITKKKKGAIDFGQDEQAAIEYAIKDLIQDGVVTGISQASQNILRSGRDLQTSIEKAALIESIPRRLKQITDPVGYAVDELNREFTKIISALNEGGASAQQYADAQKLYELERAKAIEEATQQAGKAIDDFLKEMKGGSDSPLSRRTVYDNSRAELEKFTADINSGKVVDQDDLLSAARNFQDASRELYGSSAGFFNDFNSLFDLLSKARDNAGAGSNVVDLPPSPFTGDTTIQNAINAANNNQVDAINGQTDILAGLLGTINATLASMGTASASSTTRGGGASSFLPMNRTQAV